MRSVDRLFIPCSANRDLWLVGLTMIIFIFNCSVKASINENIKAASWSHTIVCYISFLKHLQYLGVFFECKGITTIYSDTSHNSTNMYEYPCLAGICLICILILVIVGTFIFILFYNGLSNFLHFLNSWHTWHPVLYALSHSARLGQKISDL